MKASDLRSDHRKDQNAAVCVITKVEDLGRIADEKVNNLTCWTITDTQVNKFWRMSEKEAALVKIGVF